MKRNLLTKTLLVATGLLVGASAWAQTTIYERGTTENAWSDADISDTEWHQPASGNSNMSAAITNNALVVTAGSSGTAGYGKYVKTLTPNSSDTKITVNASWYEAYATGNSNSHIDFIVGDIIIKYTGSKGNGTGTGISVQIGSGSAVSYSNDVLSAAQQATYTISLAINQQTKGVTYTISDGSKSVSGAGVTGMTAGESFDVALNGGNFGRWATPNQLNSIVVSEEEIAAAEYTYTIKAKAGDTELKELGGGAAQEGGVVQVSQLNYVLSKDSKFYRLTDAAVSNYVKSFVKGAGDNEELVVEYTLDESIAYYVEAESLSGWYNDNTQKTDVASGGNTRFLAANKSVTITPSVSAGYYNIYASVFRRGNGNGNISEETVYVVNGDEETEAGKINGWGLATSPTEKSILCVYIPEGAKIKIAAAGYNSSTCYDFIYLVSVPSEEVPVNVYGTATYTTTNALDFTGITGVKAYTAAQQTDGTVLFTLVEGAVPAGTPLLVRGTTTIVPVASGSVAEVTTAMEAGTGAAVASEAGGKYNFILNAVDDVVGFYKAAGQTVAANRAYLSLSTDPTATAEESRLKIRFSDENETTSISEMQTELRGNDAIYNLNGVRVQNPTKGLYIQNGRKYIVK